jgi:hypothetical protein
VQNTRRNKTLVVGEKVPSKLLSAFREAGIVHVDRNDPAAKAKVDMALADLTRGLAAAATIRDCLKEAFMYRNGVQESVLHGEKMTDFSSPEAEREWLKEAERKYTEGKQISDLLVDRNMEMPYPKFVVKPPKAA